MPLKDSLKPNLIRIQHMIDAIKETQHFLRGKKRSTLNRNRQLLLAVIKEIELVGEAASKISESFRKKHPNVPWDQIIATRNRLIHGYFDIDTDVVWQTAQHDLKELQVKLKDILDNYY